MLSRVLVEFNLAVDIINNAGRLSAELPIRNGSLSQLYSMFNWYLFCA